MSDNTIFEPNYVDLDYSTLLARLKTQLQASDTFTDYNYEGSNIAILMELVAYLGELQTYFTNKIAKNVYIQTADQYENVHRIATQSGYEPKGYRSARTTLRIDMTNAEVNEGDQIEVDAWQQFQCSETDTDGNIIYYATTSKTISAVGCDLYIDVPVRQGIVLEEQNYTGDDMLDNEILLPKQYNYAYDDDLSDEVPTIKVLVNGEEWTRTSDFYDELSGITDTDDVYMFVYDKYERSKLVFNAIRNVPASDATIDVQLLETLGEDGMVGANAIDTFQEGLIYNATQPTVGPNSDGYITINGDDNYVTITHNATVGGKYPDTVDEIKDEVPIYRNAQFRNVTKTDYQADLNYRSDIVTSQAWGEAEVSLTGNTAEYNKVYISVIPSDWTTAQINLASDASNTLQPVAYNSDWEMELTRHLELRRCLNTYEEFVLPHLIYLTFDIAIKPKRSYDINDVRTDIKNKLIWYFDKRNRDFGELISFTLIHEYLLDTSNVKPAYGTSSGDEFENVKGIRNLIIRDMDILNSDVTIYDPNDSFNYPQYAVQSSTYTEYDNKLNNVQLGHDMFPVLTDSQCTFPEES